MECYEVKWETGRVVSSEGIVSIEVVSIETVSSCNIIDQPKALLFLPLFPPFRDSAPQFVARRFVFVVGGKKRVIRFRWVGQIK